MDISVRQIERFFYLSPDPIAIVTRGGTFVYLNSYWEEILGYSKEEMIGKEYMNFVHPEDVQRTSEEHEFLLERFRPQTFENRYLAKSGDIVWLQWRVHLDKEDELFYCTARDISQQKKMQNKLLKTQEELVLYSEKLETTNKELEAFSYSVSHDLRAPLRGINGLSQAIIEDYYDKLDHQGRDFLKRLCSEAQKMGDLIDHMLNLSRITRKEMTFEEVNLSSIAKEIAEHLQNEEPDRRVEFVIEDGIISVGDPHLLKIALENLLSNSWKFTSHHDTATIEFGSIKTTKGLTYFVRDDGAGFDMRYVDKVFGAFQRLHSDREFPGSGVGLGTVKRVISRHNGNIWVESEIEKQTTFYFTLNVEKLVKEKL